MNHTSSPLETAEQENAKAYGLVQKAMDSLRPVFETIELLSEEGQPDHDGMVAAAEHLQSAAHALSLMAGDIQRARIELQAQVPRYDHRSFNSGGVSSLESGLMPQPQWVGLTNNALANMQASMGLARAVEQSYYDVVTVHQPGNVVVTTDRQGKTEVMQARKASALQKAMAGLVKQEDRQKTEEREAVTTVFSYWQVTMRKTRSQLDQKRATRIKARLKENRGDVSELLYAVDAAKKDDFLMGRDPRANRAYNGIETIFRDRAQVEQLAERMGGYQRDEPHPALAVLAEAADA